jgi:hypothetical protein
MLLDDFSLSVSRPLSRELRAPDYRKLSARPKRHAQDRMRSKPSKRELCAKLDKLRASLPRGTPLEIWFQDEARIGRKNKITRRWAKRGTRPSAPHDQRNNPPTSLVQSAPRRARLRALVLPFCNTDTMDLHLAEIALHVAPAFMRCCLWIRPVGI